MNLATALVTAAVAAAAILAIIRLKRHPKSASCSEACSGCSLKDVCKEKDRKTAQKCD